MAQVRYDGATLTYPGADTPSVDHIDLDIADGEFLVLVGPSGCGKSTSLRMLAGLEEVTEGRILIDGEDVAGLSPKDRDVAMVFQSYALYPTMTVEENMGFALKNRKVPKAEIAKAVAEAARVLDLESVLDRKPSALSGGQRQRVAMGRAIVRKPQVFCMDEPLSNLDAKLRVSTRGEIAALQQRLGVTTVYVTHDQVEAMTMGHRVAVLNAGTLQQVATPRELYDRPANTFVAEFIGSPAMNLFHCDLAGDVAALAGSSQILPREVIARLGETTSHGENSRVTLGIRPEDLEAVSEGTEGAFPFTVTQVEELGADAFAYGALAGEAAQAHEGRRLAVRLGRDHGAAQQSTLWLRPRPERLRYFSAATGDAL